MARSRDKRIDTWQLTVEGQTIGVEIRMDQNKAGDLRSLYGSTPAGVMVKDTDIFKLRERLIEALKNELHLEWSKVIIVAGGSDREWDNELDAAPIKFVCDGTTVRRSLSLAWCITYKATTKDGKTRYRSNESCSVQVYEPLRGTCIPWTQSREAELIDLSNSLQQMAIRVRDAISNPAFADLLGAGNVRLLTKVCA